LFYTRVLHPSAVSEWLGPDFDEIYAKELMRSEDTKPLPEGLSKLWGRRARGAPVKGAGKPVENRSANSPQGDLK